MIAKIIFLLVMLIVSNLVATYVFWILVRKSYLNGELHINTTDSNEESLRIIFDKNPLTFINKSWMLLKVVNEDAKK